MIKSRHIFFLPTKLLLVLISSLLLPRTVASQSKVEIQTDLAVSRRNALVRAVEKASPAVVNISTITTKQVRAPSFLDDPWAPFFDFPFEIPRERQLNGLGSGVIIDKNGYVLTNQHVIAGADETRVILSDGREFEATVVGEDYLSDLALLEIEAPNLTQIEFGDSDDLLVGEWAIAIGHPFAVTGGDPRPTVTIGVVSATNRAIRIDDRLYQRLIQTDASINPGNSGGALVDMYGKLIGINAAIHSTSRGSQGVGFAIPVNTAERIIVLLASHGAVVPPYLGIEAQALTTEFAEKLNLGDRLGVLVTSVEKGSPAKKAGIKRSDVIEAINGQPTPNLSAFDSITRLLENDKTTTVQLIRNRNRKDVTLSIRKLQWSYRVPGWGITIKQLDREASRKYKQRGVLVTKVDRRGTLAELLEQKDLLYRINDSTVGSIEDFKRTINRLRQRQRVTLYFERDGERMRSRNLVYQ
ncbi:MAG: trypsin-like peptidase domain-containing protein [Candidatus Poribacteria bacterium]|nr:trypsin-like peptidase domain-containing protein [Candidatus Poribacteria bacterium]MDE0504976.1 trypsin-like peptidase domain-containing protein [Candidatus Poribacteria bacterium]